MIHRQKILFSISILIFVIPILFLGIHSTLSLPSKTTFVKNSTDPENEDYKILTLSADSIFIKYGLKEGDIIKSINDKSIPAIAKAGMLDNKWYEEMLKLPLIVMTPDRRIDVSAEDSLFFMLEILSTLFEFAQQKLDEISGRNVDPLSDIKLLKARLPPHNHDSSVPSSKTLEKTVELKLKKSEWEPLITAALNHADFLTSSRAVPYYENGVLAGWKFLSIREGSLFTMLGFQRGDVWSSFNGQAFDLHFIFDFLQKIKDLKAFSLTRIRRGTEQTVTCTVIDD